MSDQSLCESCVNCFKVSVKHTEGEPNYMHTETLCLVSPQAKVVHGVGMMYSYVNITTCNRYERI